MSKNIIQLNEEAVKGELKELVRKSVEETLKRNWGGEFENVSILVAIGVNSDGYREVIGAAEGLK